jgi:multidrug efflux pump subunit AcrB
VGTFKDTTGEQYPIVVRTPITQQAEFAALDEVRVPSLSGSTLPLSQLASLEFEKAPTLIQRFNRERAMTIDADAQEGFNIGVLTTEITKKLDAMQWPRGYHYSLGGEQEAGEKAFGGIGIAIIVAIFGIFAILVLEFGNFKSTLIVLTVVPLGVFGGLLMLLVSGNDISFVASIGFVALVGIEIKNSILLVDFTNQLREQGMPLDEAIEQAGEIRFLPTLLTSATAIGGLLPWHCRTSALFAHVVGDHRRPHHLDLTRTSRHTGNVQTDSSGHCRLTSERWYSRSPRGPGTNAGCPPGGLTRELDESRIPGFRHGQSR